MSLTLTVLIVALSYCNRTLLTLTVACCNGQTTEWGFDASKTGPHRFVQKPSDETLEAEPEEILTLTLTLLS